MLRSCRSNYQDPVDQSDSRMPTSPHMTITVRSFPESSMNLKRLDRSKLRDRDTALTSYSQQPRHLQMRVIFFIWFLQLPDLSRLPSSCILTEIGPRGMPTSGFRSSLRLYEIRPRQQHLRSDELASARTRLILLRGTARCIV